MTLLVIIIAAALLFIFMYNNLIATKNRVEKSFSTIDVYLEKRFDEIGALLEQTLSAMDHESDVYIEVSALRCGINRARGGAINDKVNAVNQINGFMAAPLIRVEAYPELESIRTLGVFTAQRSANVEDELAAARKHYNNNVTSFNTMIQAFPTSFIAAILGYKVPYELFKTSEQKRERPEGINNGYLNAKYNARTEAARHRN